MARIRTIKPEFWTDEDMAEVSEAACLLAIGLLNYADDEGYFNANPKLIKAAVFPIREPSVTIPVMLRELSNQGYLTLFSTSDSKHFGMISNFAKHQVVNKPRPSKIRELELLPYNYGSTTGELPLGMDQGSGNGKETPSLRANEISEPSGVSAGPNHNAILENRTPPPGGSSPLGKFLMTSDWMPEDDFDQKAAFWGNPVADGYRPEELAEFVDYWKAEGKVFHQAQWEQKFAQSVNRARMLKPNKGGNHEQTAPASSGKSRARQKIDAAYEAKFGKPLMESLGDDGTNLLGSLGGEERAGAFIALDSGDWQSQ